MKKIVIIFLFTAVFSSSSIASEIFDVINIEQGKSLSMKTWPSLTSTTLVAIPHNAQSIIYKGNTIKQGNIIWKQVYWNGNKGWVDAKYLQYNVDKTKQSLQQAIPVSPTLAPQTNTQVRATPTTVKTNINDKQTILACGGSKPFWSTHMDLTRKKILVDLQNGISFSTSLSSRKWDVDNNKMTITGGYNTQAIEAILTKTNACTDGLTTIKYPFTVEITIGNNKNVRGCCRTIQKSATRP